MFKEGQTIHSKENGVAEILFIECREGVTYYTCQTLEKDEDERVTFDALEDEISAQA